MASMFTLTVASVHDTKFSGEAESLTAPGVAGEMTILANHAPIVTTLAPGELTVRSGGEEQVIPIDHGILEVRGNSATVLL